MVFQRWWKTLSYACPSPPSNTALEDGWGSPLYPQLPWTGSVLYLSQHPASSTTVQLP